MNGRSQPPSMDKQADTGQLNPTRVDTDLLELGDRKIYWPQKVAVSQQGMISTAHYRATDAGNRILAEGGNAVDAAVAAAFALGVCEPNASGLGGQTMMLIYDAASRNLQTALTFEPGNELVKEQLEEARKQQR